MLRENPVYKMEKMTSSRSMKMTGIIFGMNIVLTAAALMMLYGMMREMQYTGEIPYQSLIQLYEMIAYFEFALVMFIVPALTAGAVSGERERQTLDLLLSTKMNCSEIIIGKLEASFRTILTVILSGAPVLSLVFIYGGISGIDFITLFLYYVMTGLFTGSMGLMLSALFQKTSAATAVTYVILLILNAGTAAAVYLSYQVSYVQYMNSTDYAVYPSAGRWIYLLLLNPAVSFYHFITGQAGSGREFEKMAAGLGTRIHPFMENYWTEISVAIQILCIVLFICVAARKINPLRGCIFKSLTSEKRDVTMS